MQFFHIGPIAKSQVAPHVYLSALIGNGTGQLWQTLAAVPGSCACYMLIVNTPQGLVVAPAFRWCTIRVFGPKAMQDHVPTAEPTVDNVAPRRLRDTLAIAPQALDHRGQHCA